MVGHMKAQITFVGIIIPFFLSMSGSIMAQSPYGWRGPERNGIYPEVGLLKTWPESGPELLWETDDAGSGHSSPVIRGEYLYITGLNTSKNKEIFSAFTIKGKKLFEVPYGKPSATTYPETALPRLFLVTRPT